jgi:hypothetical protein
MAFLLHWFFKTLAGEPFHVFFQHRYPFCLHKYWLAIFSRHHDKMQM